MVPFINDKKAAHPFWAERCPSREEWAAIKAVPKELRFRLGDAVHPSDPGRLFKCYNPMCAGGIQWISAEGLCAMAAYRRSGTPNPNAPKPAAEKLERDRARWRRNKPKKLYAHRQRLRTDPAYAERLRAQSRAKYIRRREKILARAKTPVYVIRKRLVASIKKHARTTSSGINRKNLDGARFLFWLAERNGIDLADTSWHVDHIVPLCSLNLDDESIRVWANCPENVRWLPAVENWAKNGKMPEASVIEAHQKLVAKWRSLQ